MKLKSESSKAGCLKVQNINIGPGFQVRGVVPGGAGGGIAPPNFGRSVNPISTRGSRLCLPNNTGTSRFSDLPTALQDRTDKNNTGSNTEDVIDLHMDLLVKERKLKKQILEDDDDSDFTNLPDFSAVQKEPEPIKQFKRISHKDKGNYLSACY